MRREANAVNYDRSREAFEKTRLYRDLVAGGDWAGWHLLAYADGRYDPNPEYEILPLLVESPEPPLRQNAGEIPITG
jgi:hypothetical protein